MKNRDEQGDSAKVGYFACEAKIHLRDVNEIINVQVLFSGIQADEIVMCFNSFQNIITIIVWI